MTETPLDRAHHAMETAPEDDAARLRFYERLADAELFLLLEKEAEGDNLSPEVFELSDNSFILVFDSEDRLTQFTGRPSPYAALSGRVIAQMLAGQGVGLGVNLEVAPSSILIPSDAVDWLAATLGHAPEEAQGKPVSFQRPAGVPEVMLTALDAKLSSAAGLADAAYLVGVTYDGGGKGHLLGFVNARDGAEGALAKAVSEAVTFSGIDAAALDVAFFRDADNVVSALKAYGLRYDLPAPESAPLAAPSAPGMDPSKPPKLK